MTADISISTVGKAGRITLQRPDALNAVTYEMVLAIETALDAWRDDPAVELVIIDALGDKAFSAGGDLAEMYRTGTSGDFEYGRRFWRDEYRLNCKIANYPKPYVAFCQGFTMGGGVGVSLHGSHRIVGESSKIAMPECSVGLVPDVGGSLLLARAPGHLGEFLGVTGFRMGPGDAIYCGFADSFVPEGEWYDLKEQMSKTGSPDIPLKTAPTRTLSKQQAQLDAIWSGATLADIIDGSNGDFVAGITAASPLSTACTIDLIRKVRTAGTIEAALATEYRFTHRVMEHGDFLEGIRALIVDKDRNPAWKHGTVHDVSQSQIDFMLSDLGADELKFL